MRLLSVLTVVTLAVLAVAQDIAFTTVPASVVVGHSYNITWGGGDSTEDVTITLRKGDVDDIQTVQVLTSESLSHLNVSCTETSIASAFNGSYTWTPSSSLLNGDDYTLQITQGLNDINFSGEFTVSGGVDPISASISSILASESAALSSANATITSLASITSSYAAASSSGTGTALPRNTTFSSATLGTSESATATSGSSESGTGAAASSTSSAGADSISSNYASPLAFFCGVLAAIGYAI
ncbi:putative extracellular matrix protein [Phaeomoniella chlamydospora]|uniref:Putative extracellular matrix protein n=1 Tax=Phaeomoniella chlamydospora TaxID=158046 RepID=A0A0G2EUW3_PHACM|nr:putative extracellular matrix protein [Phaeomoniella chlamydospora]